MEYLVFYRAQRTQLKDISLINRHIVRKVIILVILDFRKPLLNKGQSPKVFHRDLLNAARVQKLHAAFFRWSVYLEGVSLTLRLPVPGLHLRTFLPKSAKDTYVPCPFLRRRLCMYNSTYLYKLILQANKMVTLCLVTKVVRPRV